MNPGREGRKGRYSRSKVPRKKSKKEGEGVVAGGRQVGRVSRREVVGRAGRWRVEELWGKVR